MPLTVTPEQAFQRLPTLPGFRRDVVQVSRGEFSNLNPPVNVITGRGCVARAQIAQGDLILDEAPFFRLCQSQFVVPQQHLTDQRWLDLQSVSSPGITFGRGPEYDKFRTNCLRCGTHPLPNSLRREIASGIFPKAALFNSSCAPNIHAHWNIQAQRMEFRAAREIAPMEELCICYDVNVLLYSRDSRQQRLGVRFGFTCVCHVCTLVSPRLEDSNMRRLAHRDIVQGGAMRMAPGLAIATITAAIQDLRIEGIHHFLDTLYYDAYRCWWRVAGADAYNNAMLYLQMARDLTQDMVGPEDQRVVEMIERLPENLR